jgi:hypothetical protein
MRLSPIRSGPAERQPMIHFRQATKRGTKPARTTKTGSLAAAGFKPIGPRRQTRYPRRYLFWRPADNTGGRAYDPAP